MNECVCSNCGATHSIEDGMHLMRKDCLVASLCETCVTGVKVGKIVFRREGKTFVYEGYLPVESD